MHFQRRAKGLYFIFLYIKLHQKKKRKPLEWSVWQRNNFINNRQGNSFCTLQIEAKAHRKIQKKAKTITVQSTWLIDFMFEPKKTLRRWRERLNNRLLPYIYKNSYCIRIRKLLCCICYAFNVLDKKRTKKKQQNEVKLIRKVGAEPKQSLFLDT